MHAAVHPSDVSPALTGALNHAGLRPVPVPDVLALTELEPEGGWGLLVVELGGDPGPRLAFARRAKEAGLAPVLVVAEATHVVELAGATFDDFVLMPADRSEVVVRIHRLTVPPPGSVGEVLHFKDLTLDLATYQATVAGSPVDLTFMEYELLRFFVAHPARVWSREQLLQRVWGYDYFGGARTVDVHVRRLRAKLGEERASWITTVRSVGYRFG